MGDSRRVLGFSQDGFHRVKDLYEAGRKAVLAETSGKQRDARSRANPVSRRQLSSLPWSIPPLAKFERPTICASDPWRGVRTICQCHDPRTCRLCPKARPAEIVLEGFSFTGDQARDLEIGKAERLVLGGIEARRPWLHGVLAYS